MCSTRLSIHNAAKSVEFGAYILDSHTKYPAAAVWGIIIDAEHMCKQFDESRGLTKLRETDYDAWQKAFEGFDRFISNEHMNQLKEKMASVFKTPYPITVTRVVDCRELGDWESKEVDCIFMMIMATRRDDRFIPSPDAVEKLTSMARGYGFECWAG
ncbi:hypothetical protein BJ165DRAFT_1407572 [Panaeolus papilionaceus]|nr:hypothetical protein BJ165DRAFT_1407572 [Panaeolus papilionaceus]